MRPLRLLLIASLVAAAAPATAAAAPANPCAALKGRDLAPGAGQRAVLRGPTLHFCKRGGRIRRLGGSPVVRATEDWMALVHRRGTAEVLDLSTGRRGALGPVGEIVATELIGYAGAAAVRRTAAGDTVLAVIPGGPRVVVERGAKPVEAFSGKAVVSWQRGGVTRMADFPDHRRRCDALTGPDVLEGPGRIVASVAGYEGCAGAPDSPVFEVGDTFSSDPDESVSLHFTPGAGAWVLRERSRDHPYMSHSAWDTLDLATGRFMTVAANQRYVDADHSGNRVAQHVLLADGRSAFILHDDLVGWTPRRSTVTVRGPGFAGVDLDRTERDAPLATNLRVEGELVRWSVGSEERSAPLPPVG